MLLEVCVDSYSSAMAAVRGGADRLELCSALAVGGLSPWRTLLAQIRKDTDIPIRCLIRPRPGDFLYTEDELDLLSSQILDLHRQGATGFVLGALKAGGELDKKAMRRMIGATGGAPVTLHRAFDVARNQEDAYLDAVNLGLDAVLTSGGAADCMAGSDAIGRLLSLRGEHNGPDILVGAGVTAENILALRRRYPTLRSFHLSAKAAQPSKMRYRREGVPMGLPGFDEWSSYYASEQLVREAKAALTAPLEE
ncbi:MAG: copper homeostasis protein CutC [Gemmiger sp.]|nr:copper homeostasis protein CutC [Gemmiger sp.]